MVHINFILCSAYILHTLLVRAEDGMNTDVVVGLVVTDDDVTVVGRLAVMVVNSVLLVLPSTSGRSKSTFQPVNTSIKYQHDDKDFAKFLKLFWCDPDFSNSPNFQQN